MVFQHSVKVPTQYRKAAAVFRKAISEKKSIKSVLYEQKHARINHLLALFQKYCDNRVAIEEAIEKTNLFTENPRLDPSLARVLVTELLFGTGTLNGSSAKPIAYVLSFENKLKEAIESSSAQPETKTKRVNKPRYVRINTNAITIEDILEILASGEWKRKETSTENYDEFLQAIQNIDEDEYIVDMHVPSLLIFSPKWKHFWANHVLTAEKKLILQDRATSITSHLLNPKPNSIVLDMCAAPGMKTIHLSNIMQNKGTIYAVEQDDVRHTLLCQMIKDAHASCVVPIKADALTITDEDVPHVEYILVDPTCSGSGIQNRMSLTDEIKDEDRLKKLGGLQIKILLHAMTAFPKAKRIVYSTCSLYEEENEKVVKKCLKKCPNFKLLNGKKCLNRKWNNVGSVEYKGVGKNCLYALPNKDFTDGLFMAVFERIHDE